MRFVFLSLSLSVFFLLMCRNMFWRRRIKNGLGVFLMLLFSEMMMILMMIMQRMYVATVIELETYVRTRAKCVCVWALPTDAIEYWRKQKDALIELFLSLTIRRCWMFLFILKLFFQVTYDIYQGNNKWQYREIKEEEEEKSKAKMNKTNIPKECILAWLSW